MALFFDELVPYGDWVDYKQYGPVWYPTKDVEERLAALPGWALGPLRQGLGV